MRLINELALATAISVILIYEQVTAFSIVGRDLRRVGPPALQTCSPFESTRSSSPCSKKSSTTLKGEEEEECFFGDDPTQIPDACIDLPGPDESFSAVDVVTMCMSFLESNDVPKANSGLEVCYNFSSDSCRAANGGSLETFLQYANNPVFQSMVNCLEWEVLNDGPEIPETNTRGAMKTVLIKVVQKEVDGEQRNDRKFLWTLMQERRPPRQGCFLVHECLAVENAFAQTV